MNKTICITQMGIYETKVPCDRFFYDFDRKI